MNRNVAVMMLMSLTLILAGCQTSPPDSETGPDKTVAHYMKVESSEPGVTIETNKIFAGVTPVTLKVNGDVTGTFHNFGSSEYVLRAFPLSSNQFPQTKVFKTGTSSIPGDHIPGLIFFDMDQRNGALIIDSITDK
jgi:hypothetical protein